MAGRTWAGRSVTDKTDDIQLKFDGGAVERLNGAPAEALIASLNALQRMVYIIGMRAEGRALSERLKPSAKVKREYALICRAPEAGSHIQPFNVASQSGAFTPAAVVARDKLLATLSAFNSGSGEQVERVLPNARERWFMAKAALGLIPGDDADLEISVRTGGRGNLTFNADRARDVIHRYQTGTPPEVDEEEIAGKLKAIDFSQTILTVKPSSGPAIRLDYPLKLEEWLQANVRRRVKLVGKPKFNQRGDISSLKQINIAVELEPTLEPIEEFTAGGDVIRATRPLSIPVMVDWQDKLFIFQDETLGVDVFAQSYRELRECVLSELNLLWRQYAMAPDEDLDTEALNVKRALLSRFGVVRS